MKIFNYSDVELKDGLRWLIRGPHFDMRMGELGPFEKTYHGPHVHPWEHEVYIIEGNGDIWDGEERRSFEEGDVIYIPSGEPHTFINTSEKILRFICCIPADVDLNQIMTAGH